MFAGTVPWNLLLAAVLTGYFGPPGLLVLLWLPWSAYAAWRQAGYMAWAVDDRLVAVRGGFDRIGRKDRLRWLLLGRHGCLSCRCTIGDDHDDGDMLSASEAEDIWLSSGMDPDYDFR